MIMCRGGYVVYREKNIDDGTARQEENRKAKEEFYGYGKGGHAGSQCDREIYKWQG